MEKKLYKILLFLLLILSLFDLILLILVTVYGSEYPQLSPFQLIIGLSFIIVNSFLLMVWKKYKTLFKTNGQ